VQRLRATGPVTDRSLNCVHEGGVAEVKRIPHRATGCNEHVTELRMRLKVENGCVVARRRHRNAIYVDATSVSQPAPELPQALTCNVCAPAEAVTAE